MTDNGGQIGADLTPREREVLAMVAAGMTNREIGGALFISESTAGVHVSNLMAKLGVSTRTEATAVAYRAGLVESAAGISPTEAVPVSGATLEGAPLPRGWWARLSHTFQNQMEHHPGRVAAVGIGGLAILSFITIGLAMAVFGEPPVAGDGETPTRSPRPTASEVASASPSPSQEPSETPIPIGGVGVDLDVDGLAEILVDDLILRAGPGTGTIRLGQLPGGATAFVVAGPLIEDGYAWYQLAAVDPFGAGCGSAQPADSLVCRDWFGWAAAGGQDGEAWLARVEPVCPAPGNPATMMTLKPLEGLACFGGSSMTLRVYATANPQGGGCAPGDPFAPAWLAPCAAVSLEEAESLYPAVDTLWIQIAPTLGSCNGQGFGPNCPLAALHGRWIRITAHLDDPQAQNCTATASTDQEPTILQCRAALVATAITPDDGLGMLDQRQETWVPEFPVGYQPHASDSAFSAGVAQTFRAGRTGELTAIQIPLNRLASTSGPLVVQIRRGDPDGELMATSPSSSWSGLPTDPGSCLPPQCLALDREFAWVMIRFDQPADLVAGQTYAIVLPSGTITGSPNPTFLLASSTANAYANGVEWGRGPNEGDPWQAYGSGADLAFRTIVR
ncbi:MAG: response regulator transcription factor [Candidatus Limnocylindria bacterium]